MGDNMWEDYMEAIEQIVTIDAEKFKRILMKVNSTVLTDLYERLATQAKIKFNLEQFEINKVPRITSMISYIWLCSISLVENKFNEKCNAMFAPPVILPSKFIEDSNQMTSTINVDTNDFNKIADLFQALKSEVDSLKKEVEDLKFDNNKMKIEVNALKTNNNELNRRILELTTVPKTPLSGYFFFFFFFFLKWHGQSLAQ